MRLVLARCAVDYQGRLGARLEPALRLILIKADGSIAIHADSGAYKPLNWMTPPCSVEESEGWFRVRNAKGELLAIELLEVVHDHHVDLGDDPGLAKDGVEAELQALLAGQPQVLEPGLALVRREYLTDIGPVDLLCRDATGGAVAVEVKRVGEIAGVEQLVRYLERLDLDPRLRPVRGIFVATRVKPQARVFASSRRIEWCEIDPAKLRADAEADLTLF